MHEQSGIGQRDLRHWYLVQTKPRAQLTAEHNLILQGFEVFAPKHDETRRLRSGFRTLKRPLFPGYLFVRAEPLADAWRSISGTLGVARLVQFGDRGPARIPCQLMSSLMRRSDGEGRFDAAPLRPGDRVRMFQGPLTDFVATVESIAPNRRAWLLLDFMGRHTRMLAKRAELQPA